jgi:hypothetical protein
MGEDSKGIAASEGSDGIGSCQTQDVGISPQEDRGGAAGTVGEGKGSQEKGGLEPREPAPRMRQAFLLEVNLWAVRTVEALK